MIGLFGSFQLEASVEKMWRKYCGLDGWLIVGCGQLTFPTDIAKAAYDFCTKAEKDKTDLGGPLRIPCIVG